GKLSFVARSRKNAILHSLCALNSQVRFLRMEECTWHILLNLTSLPALQPKPKLKKISWRQCGSSWKKRQRKDRFLRFWKKLDSSAANTRLLVRVFYFLSE